MFLMLRWRWPAWGCLYSIVDEGGDGDGWYGDPSTGSFWGGAHVGMRVGVGGQLIYVALT